MRRFLMLMRQVCMRMVARVRRECGVHGLTLALSGGAAVASAKPTDNTIGGHYVEPASGPVRFNAGLGIGRGMSFTCSEFC